MSKPLHVMSVRNVIAFGGPDTTILGWFAHLDRTRLRVSLASFDNPGRPDREFLERLEALEVETCRIPWGGLVRMFSTVRALAKLIREREVDLLHTHDTRADVIGYLAARIAGIPVMTTIYVWFQSTSVRKMRYFEAIDRLFLRHFDGLTAISEATRRQTVAFGFPPESVETIYSGIDLDKFSGRVDVESVRRSLGARPQDRLMIYVARFWPEKAHVALVEALQDVVRAEPRARLVLVGDGPCRAQAQLRARELGIAEHVIFTGIRADVPQILRACEMMVHPSLAEGIALGMQEGMAAGLPVIGTDVDGTPEVILNEQTGLLIPVNDRPALAGAMQRLLADTALARRLGASARTLIETKLSAERVTRQLENTYLRVHGEFPRNRRGRA